MNPLRYGKATGIQSRRYYVDRLVWSTWDGKWLDCRFRRIDSRQLSALVWRGFDQGVIDAALNGSADGARELSDEVRHMQSGNVRSYAAWVAVGATAVIAYMVWVGLRTP